MREQGGFYFHFCLICVVFEKRRGRVWQAVFAFSAGISVLMGAFGAHVFKDLLSPGRMDVYERAGFYLLTHSIAGLMLSFVNNTANIRILKTGTILIYAGSVVFSICLYLVSMSDLPGMKPLRFAGAVAPLGGTAMIGGWMVAAYSFYKSGAHE